MSTAPIFYQQCDILPKTQKEPRNYILMKRFLTPPSHGVNMTCFAMLCLIATASPPQLLAANPNNTFSLMDGRFLF